MKLSLPLHLLTFIAISICILTILNVHPTSAQNATSVNFETYQNPTLGFTLQYPSNWKVDEDRSSDGLVQFFIPHRNLAIFHVSVKNVTRYFDTDTLTIKNKTAQMYALERLDTLSKISADADFKQIRQNEFNIAGNSGWKIEYTDNLGLLDLSKEFAKRLDLGAKYNFEVFTVANGKVYTLAFNEKFLKVPETVPLANKVVESFHTIA
jgi:hypothetical protein